MLARIDTRLLHGQVATSWTKTTNPDRIIVVSDNVAKDNLRSSMIKQAAPAGVKAHVVPIEQMIKLAKDDKHFGGTRAMLLFETPQDALKAIEGGVPIRLWTLAQWLIQLEKFNQILYWAFDQNDIDTYKKLENMGVQMDVRKVPSDSRDNLDAIMKKAQDELNKQKNN